MHVFPSFDMTSIAHAALSFSLSVHVCAWMLTSLCMCMCVRVRSWCL
jgi:hypothetical protein